MGPFSYSSRQKIPHCLKSSCLQDNNFQLYLDYKPDRVMDIEIEEKKEWARIRLIANQAYKYDEVWEDAIRLFEKRVSRKFFDPIQLIIDRRTLKGEGFTIVMVQCALIEMFAAFREGKIFNHFCTSASPKYEYKDSKNWFVRFLRTDPIFENIFWKRNPKGNTIIDQPYSAAKFYECVRCGLMHECRTKENWIISATPKEKSSKIEQSFLAPKGTEIVIYRTVFHYRLLTYLSNYIQDLQQETQEGRTLRKHLARKLDNLFDYPADASNWWTV